MSERVCRCGAPIKPPRKAYCSDECFKAAETVRKRESERRRYENDPAYRERAKAKRRRNYREAQQDPERRARYEAKRAEWMAANRDAMTFYHQTYRQRLEQNPEKLAEVRKRDREYKREQRKANPDLYRQRTKADYWRVRSDPKLWKQRLEWQRMYYRLRQEAQGKTLVHDRDSNSHPGPEMYVGPLRERVLQRLAALHEGEPLSEEDYSGVVGVSARTLNRWKKPHARTRASDVDAALCALDLNWWDVYEKPANGHKSGKPEDVLRYIADAEVYVQACLAFEGELV
jgi:hypothetical protein